MSNRFQPWHLDLLPRIRQYGIECVEIPVLDSLGIETLPLRRALEANDLGVSLCAILPNGTNPISPDKEVRNKAIDHLRTCIKITADLGGCLLCGPVYAPIGYLPQPSRTASEWDWALECFRQLIPLPDETGITLALEPVSRYETHFMKTSAEGQRFCEALNHPRIGITIDTFHANIEERNIVEAISPLGRYLKHMHLSENNRGILGTGHIDFPMIICELKRIEFQGTLIIEGSGSSIAAGKMDALWRNPSIQSDELAQSSAQYLQTLL